MTALAIIHRDSIIEQVAQGKRLSDIAPHLGITRQAISKVLKEDPEYRDAIELGLEAKLDQRETELEAAGDQVDLARARELLSHSRWKAERECPSRWGQRQQVDLNVSGPLVNITVASMPTVEAIEHDPDHDDNV